MEVALVTWQINLGCLLRASSSWGLYWIQWHQFGESTNTALLVRVMSVIPCPQCSITSCSILSNLANFQNYCVKYALSWCKFLLVHYFVAICCATIDESSTINHLDYVIRGKNQLINLVLAKSVIGINQTASSRGDNQINMQLVRSPPRDIDWIFG